MSMELMQKATPEQIERAVELMEETDTEHFHVDDAQILAWFPADFIRLATEWLESELNEE